VYVKEYVVDDHVKLVYVCNSNECLVIGDLPALEWCFEVGEELSIGEVRLCYSRRSEIDVMGDSVHVVIEGAEVLGQLRSVSFVAYDVRGDLRPEALYKAVVNYVNTACSGAYKDLT